MWNDVLHQNPAVLHVTSARARRHAEANVNAAGKRAVYEKPCMNHSAGARVRVCIMGEYSCKSQKQGSIKKAAGGDAASRVYFSAVAVFLSHLKKPANQQS